MEGLRTHYCLSKKQLQTTSLTICSQGIEYSSDLFCKWSMVAGAAYILEETLNDDRSSFPQSKQIPYKNSLSSCREGKKKKTDSGCNSFPGLNGDSVFFTIYLPNNKFQIPCLKLFRWEFTTLIILDLNLYKLLCFCFLSEGITSRHHHAQPAII